jgi:N-acyl-phosphatidylethanolamine-hydrolysing phospholipase D
LKVNGHESTLTWIGHSTLLLQIGGINILTDPHLTDRASPLSWAGPKRCVPPGLGFADLPAIHLVLLSHNHYDHLDLPTLRHFARQSYEQQPLTIVPLGLKTFLAEQGLRKVVELDWWEQVSFRDIIVHAVPAQHFSARSPFDRNQSLWAGFVVEHATFRFFFAGDTGYSADFKLIGQELGPMDLAAIPIGAYEPRWFMRPMHVNPEEAVKIHQDVRSRRSVAIHWGTFELTDEPLDEPPRRLRQALTRAGISAEEFFVMQHGETRHLGVPHVDSSISGEKATSDARGHASPESSKLTLQA